jgi:hypothetical protein
MSKMGNFYFENGSTDIRNNMADKHNVNVGSNQNKLYHIYSLNYKHKLCWDTLII